MTYRAYQMISGLSFLCSFSAVMITCTGTYYFKLFHKKKYILKNGQAFLSELEI
jgi:hypothetical protein